MAEIPKQPDGTHDKDAVKVLYMASKQIDWTRFCEEQGWDNHATRPLFPVATWQNEKRQRLAIAQGDTIAALMFERRYEWTHDVLKALKSNPAIVEAAAKLVEAKMSTQGALYNDYVKWREEGKHIGPRGKRLMHPWEKLDISRITRAAKDVVDARNSALLLDKTFAPDKLHIPTEELAPQDAAIEKIVGPTIEGGNEFTYERMQGWLDRYLDKPQAPIIEVPKDPEPGKPPPPPETILKKAMPTQEDQDKPPVIIDGGN